MNHNHYYLKGTINILDFKSEIYFSGDKKKIEDSILKLLKLIHLDLYFYINF